MPKAAQTDGGPEPAVSTASGEKSDDLPKSVTRRLDEIDKTLSQLTDLFGKFQEKPMDSLANELDRYTQAVDNQMEQLMKYYGDKIPAGNPKVKEREDKIAAYKEKYNQVTG